MGIPEAPQLELPLKRAQSKNIRVGESTRGRSKDGVELPYEVQGNN